MTERADDTPSGSATDGAGAVRGDVLSSTTRRRGPSRAVGLVRRQLRRPVSRVTALYRRSIQLRVVAVSLLASIAVVLVLGVVVVAQVRTGLLGTKMDAARAQARIGFQVEQKKIDEARDQKLRGTGDPTVDETGTWLLRQVNDLAGSGQTVYSVIAMAPGTGAVAPDTAGFAPRYSGDIQPISIPDTLRAKLLAESGQMFEQPTRIHRSPDSTVKSEPGLALGMQFTGPAGTPYQLFYVFSFGQETDTLNLVTGTLATAGVFVVILMGGIAWVVVRQVVTPVRMAAGISERLADGHLEERMKITGTDDIARLGESFNRMANALQAQIRQLEELSRVQRRFVSDVSHELRTPLTTVRMAADLIYDSREDLDPMAARSAELLQGQLDRFESLLADLLEISRFDAGAAILDAEPVDLREIVGRVVEAAEPLAEAKGSAVVIRGDGEPVLAEVDSRRIERILRNLVVNALEHGEGRDVVVRLGSADGAVAVGVRDYGIGLKPGEASRVFHRFWRADPSRVRTTGGTGLGLSIAVEDAHLHGGWLQAWGEPGGGSHFRLTLPRTRGGEISRAPFRLEPEDSRNNRGLGAQGTPYRRAISPAGSTATAAVDDHAETPEGAGSSLGSGLGGVLNIGPGLSRRRLPEGPRSDPSDVWTAGGYGATGAQVMVDPTPGRPSVAQRTAEPDAMGGTTDAEGSQRAKDEQQD
ncbi:MtrAB system histidine kinase MtrB [Kitasatospora sp. NPDC056783]|uniref:MtrAB system histidine kinase MtrB n=1 Tax=Kitasatospora sp. NPDC056783 TaxID=3345943 RepID=UPI0036A2D212